MSGRKVTIYLDDGESWETRLSDEEMNALLMEVNETNEVIQKMAAEEDKELPRYTLPMEIVNAIHEYVRRLKMDQHSGNCEGPNNK